jgi:hypothetical protein
VSAEALEKFLDEHAVPARKDDFIRVWLSPDARNTHARTAKETTTLASLFSVMADARPGQEFNKASSPQRIEYREILVFGFWICRPAANCPTYMLIVRRTDETRPWRAELERALAVE